MATWGEFATASPALAEWGRKRFERARIGYLGTVGADGVPHITPVAVVICQDHLVLFLHPDSPKAENLRSSGVFALHSAVHDPSSAGGEFIVKGRATLVENSDMRRQAIENACYTPPENTIMFELFVESATATEYDEGTAVKRNWAAPAPTA